MKTPRLTITAAFLLALGLGLSACGQTDLVKREPGVPLGFGVSTSNGGHGGAGG